MAVARSHGGRRRSDTGVGKEARLQSSFRKSEGLVVSTSERDIILVAFRTAMSNQGYLYS